MQQSTSTASPSPASSSTSAYFSFSENGLCEPLDAQPADLKGKGRMPTMPTHLRSSSAPYAPSTSAKTRPPRPQSSSTRGRSQTLYFIPHFLTKQSNLNNKKRSRSESPTSPTSSRPTLMRKCSEKSKPCSPDVDRAECRKGYRLRCERRDEDGFVVNAVTALREVL